MTESLFGTRHARSSVMRSALTITAMLLSAAAIAQPATRPDLYGTWKLDAASSQWGALAPAQGAISAGTLSIEKHHKTLHMALTVKFDHGDRTDEMDWRVDDKYHPVSGPASGEILAKWQGRSSGR